MLAGERDTWAGRMREDDEDDEPVTSRRRSSSILEALGFKQSKFIVCSGDKLEKDSLKDAPVYAFGKEGDCFETRQLIKEASLGNRDSQFSLGYYYDVGSKGIEPDTDQAVHWYTQAALQGHPTAANNLGVLYSTGHRGKIACNWAEAMRWYELSARLGNPNAAFHIGLAYFTGDGVEKKDDILAFQWFKKAGKKGHILGISNVGAMYMGGRGVEKNLKKALKWLHKAVDMYGDTVAAHNLGVMYLKGLGTRPSPMMAERYFLMVQSSSKMVIPDHLAKQTMETGQPLYNSH